MSKLGSTVSTKTDSIIQTHRTRGDFDRDVDPVLGEPVDLEGSLSPVSNKSGTLWSRDIGRVPFRIPEGGRAGGVLTIPRNERSLAEGSLACEVMGSGVEESLACEVVGSGVEGSRRGAPGPGRLSRGRKPDGCTGRREGVRINL